MGSLYEVFGRLRAVTGVSFWVCTFDYEVGKPERMSFAAFIGKVSSENFSMTLP